MLNLCSSLVVTAKTVCLFREAFCYTFLYVKMIPSVFSLLCLNLRLQKQTKQFISIQVYMRANDTKIVLFVLFFEIITSVKIDR